MVTGTTNTVLRPRGNAIRDMIAEHVEPTQVGSVGG